MNINNLSTIVECSRKYMLYVVLTMSVIITNGCGGKGAGQIRPMGVRQNVEITDGESLRYTISTRGRKTGEFRMVTKKNSDSIVKTYLLLNHENSNDSEITDYQKFPSYAIVDISTGSMKKYYVDETEYYINQNKAKGRYYLDAEIGSNITVNKKEWDGFESRQSRSVVKISDNSFPVWQKEAFLFWGGRLLDWENKGAVLIWADDILKEPIFGTLNTLGQEKIITDAGTFDCLRVQWGVADPFVGPLLKGVTDKITIWIENAPSHRLIQIKFEFLSQIWKLSEAKVVTDSISTIQLSSQ